MVDALIVVDIHGLSINMAEDDGPGVLTQDHQLAEKALATSERQSGQRDGRVDSATTVGFPADIRASTTRQERRVGGPRSRAPDCGSQ